MSQKDSKKTVKNSNLEVDSKQNKKVEVTLNWKVEKKRLLAEIDNLHKQRQNEMLDHYRYRHQDLITELLVVVDALHNSLLFKQNNEETKQFLKGIKMTVDQFDKILDRFGTEKIKTKVGDHYDPSLHQTLEAKWDHKHPEGVILKIAQHGYTLQGRVLRPTKVVINQKPRKEQQKVN